MDLAESVHHRHQDVPGSFERYSFALAPEVLFQGQAVEVAHDDIGGLSPGIGKKIQNFDNAGMIVKSGKGSGLFLKLLETIFKVAPGLDAVGGYSRCAGLPGRELSGEVFLYCEPYSKLKVPAYVCDSESAMPQHLTDQILVVEYRAGF